MQYKGFEISAIYLPGAAFSVSKFDKIVKRKPKHSDIDYWESVCLTDNEVFTSGHTLEECKKDIDALHDKLTKQGLTLKDLEI